MLIIRELCAGSMGDTEAMVAFAVVEDMVVDVLQTLMKLRYSGRKQGR